VVGGTQYSWLILPFRSHRSGNCGLRSSVFHFYTQTDTCTKQASRIETTHAHRSRLRACSMKPLMCPRCPSPLSHNDSAMPGSLICIRHCLCLIHRQHTQRWISTRAMGLPITITETTPKCRLRYMKPLKNQSSLEKFAC
jgi:hypothetical protein